MLAICCTGKSLEKSLMISVFVRSLPFPSDCRSAVEALELVPSRRCMCESEKGGGCVTNVSSSATPLAMSRIRVLCCVARSDDL